MVAFPIQVKVLIKASGFYNPRRLVFIELLSLGLSNKSIAEELKLSIKSVERMLSEFNTKLGNQIKREYGDLRKVFNPRTRLLMTFIAEDICEITSNANPRFIEELNESLRDTLLLSCTGFSNKGIAEILGITEKAVELRFTQLFDYFGIDTKVLNEENPRVNLFIGAYCRGHIQKSQIKKLYRETQFDRLDEILVKPEKFLTGLHNIHKFIG